MATSDDILAGFAGATRGVQDILGALLQFKLREQGNYINVDEIPENLRNELGITQTTKRINKALIPLYRQPTSLTYDAEGNLVPLPGKFAGRAIITGSRLPQTKQQPSEDIPTMTQEEARRIAEGKGSIKRDTKIIPQLRTPFIRGENSTEGLKTELSKHLNNVLMGKSINPHQIKLDLQKKYGNADWQDQRIQNLINNFPQPYSDVFKTISNVPSIKSTRKPVFQEQKTNFPVVNKKPIDFFDVR